MLSLNRAEFAHALKAVLEHSGTADSKLDWVGFGGNQLYATDGYSALIWHSGYGPGMQDWKLSVKEAKELLRYVKPNRVREKDEEVQLLDHQNPETGEWELHVGLFVPLDETKPVESQIDNAGTTYDSEVYSLLDTTYSDLSTKTLWGAIEHYAAERLFSSDWVVQSALVARFKSAEIEYGDRTHWYLSGRSQDGAHAAVVTVGSNFIGCVMGLGEPVGESTYQLRDSTLEEWGLGERA